MTCASEIDPDTSNVGVGISSVPASNTFAPGLDSYRIAFQNIGPGFYTFTLFQRASSNAVVETVPTPGALALLGLGLLGMGAVRRHKA